LLVGDATFGEKSFVDELKEMCRELGVAEKVVFTGFRDDVPVIMRSIDLLVHASTLPEPFGMVLIEAMAASRPVVATRAGGVQEIVDSGVTGILVPPGDEDAMARAIVEILSDGGLRQRMGEAGLRRVEERFSRDETTRGIEREMLAILEERKTSC
jgi:glycosyltransferase involved in cell wall biosynthesis